MSIMVKDCLNLPSLSLGRVVAGEKGLNGIVNAITVIEFDFTDVSLYTPNEICITAFYNIKGNVDMQCEAIEAFKKCGDVALILFYSDTILNGLDPRVIETANQLDFPIIQLPGEDMGLKYSDVISDIMEAIVVNAKSTNSYVNNTLDMIAQMTENHRNINNVLGFASAHGRAGFFLFDSNLNVIGHSFWPTANIVDINELKEFLQSEGTNSSYFHCQLGHCYRQNFETKSNASLVLVAISQNQKLSWQTISDTVEILQLFSTIWNYNLKTSSKESLITALLEGDISLADRICSYNSITISDYGAMLLIDSANGEIVEWYRENLQATNYSSTQFREIIIDTFGKVTVAYMPKGFCDTTNGSLFLDQLNHFCCSKMANSFTLFKGINVKEDSKQLYADYCGNIIQARKIYPHVEGISSEQLLFAERCNRIIHSGGKDYWYYLNLLRPIYDGEDPDVWNTLEVYLFDAGSQVKITSELLFIHRNTVQYRLNKVSEFLNGNIDLMPLSYEVYISAALHRIIR